MSNKKNGSLISSFNNAINGIIQCLKSERNMKVHFFSAVIILTGSLFFDLSRVEFLIVCLAIALVIICELFNTVIEAAVDLITKEYSINVKRIKDMSAGAVMVSAFFSLIVAYFIFFDRVATELENGILRIKQTPMHIAIIALTLTLIAVLVIKAFYKKGTPLRGGMPSGHSAIAFSITTAIALWGNNTGITILCLLLALLVAQSRFETKIHTLYEIITGAVLGFMITWCLFVFFC